jgi:hypothetical protein
VLRDMLTAMALCNNVTPVIEKDDAYQHEVAPLSKIEEKVVDEREARKSIIDG